MIPTVPGQYYRKRRVLAAAGEEPHLIARRELAAAIVQIVTLHGGREHRHAMFGVSQPRFSNLLNGRVERFTVDSLVNMLAHAGYSVQIEVSEAPERRVAWRRPPNHRRRG